MIGHINNGLDINVFRGSGVEPQRPEKSDDRSTSLFDRYEPGRSDEAATYARGRENPFPHPRTEDPREIETSANRGKPENIGDNERTGERKNERAHSGRGVRRKREIADTPEIEDTEETTDTQDTGVTDVPNAVAGAEGTEATESTEDAEKSQNREESKNSQTGELSEEESREVQELKAADRKVRQHEMAHQAAAAGIAVSGATFEYQRGPDGVNYAVGGEVQIDTSEESTPEKTMQKAQKIIAAAMAPADPSPQDRNVAARARAMEANARTEMAKEKQQEAQETQQPGEQRKPGVPTENTETTGAEKAQKSAKTFQKEMKNPGIEAYKKTQSFAPYVSSRPMLDMVA